MLDCVLSFLFYLKVLPLRENIYSGLIAGLVIYRTNEPFIPRQVWKYGKLLHMILKNKALLF